MKAEGEIPVSLLHTLSAQGKDLILEGFHRDWLRLGQKRSHETAYGGE
jgi:hypothetical protein